MPVHCRVALSVKFASTHLERHCQSKLSCPKNNTMFPTRAWRWEARSRVAHSNHVATVPPNPECLMLIIGLSHFLRNTHELDYTKLYQNFLRSMPNAHSHGVTQRMTFHTSRPVQRRPSMLNKHSRPLPKMPLPRKQRWSYTTISLTK